MVTTKLPLNPVGYVSEDWLSLVGELYERIADVQWPLSLDTYSQMRRDPRLTAVLAAHKLPITRAGWSVDPTGCRPGAAQLVADGLGLPMAGSDTPTAARTRGVSWAEHLRLALTCLDYGHAGFELQADVTSGAARLAELLERPQTTITTMHIHRQGKLTGVSQDARSENTTPEITADRLCWHAHQREGTNWAGISLLRPAYAPWLLRRELMRVHATSCRRFGMGVPTIQWAPGSTPTNAQHQEAFHVAQQARAGDQAGAALPPGAALVLQGLTGAVPDTLGFIRFLDQQMSQMALAGFMDLGDTSNGSRALGESFVDLFLLSLQSIADHVADTITRQVAARVVAWNWGEDEPVPVVRVADVGSRHEVTAEALNSLVQSGALSAEPGLESWIRRMWRLPDYQRPPTPAAVPPTSTTPPDTPVTVAAAAPQREPTADELASGVDFQAHAQDHEQESTQLVGAWQEQGPTLVDAVVALVLAGLASGGVAGLAGLVLPEADLTPLVDVVSAALTRAADRASSRVEGELAALGTPVVVPPVDPDLVTARARVAAHLIGSGMTNAAVRAATLHGTDPQQVEPAIRAVLGPLVSDQGWVAGSLRSCVSAAAGMARMAAYETVAQEHGEQGMVWVASEIHDSHQCEACHEVDGKRYTSLAAARRAYPAGQYVGCAGGDRCRGTLIMLRA